MVSVDRRLWLCAVMVLACAKGPPAGGAPDGGAGTGGAASPGGTGGGAPPDAAPGDDGSSDAADRPGATCAIEGIYSPVQAQMIEGACSYPITASELDLRQLPDGPWAVDFDATTWLPATVDAGTCAVTARTGNWSFNDASRQRVLTFSVAGDALTGEMTDLITGTDTFGGTCNVRYRLSAHRISKVPPPGQPVGADCGGLGCSGARCAFGNEPLCASGVCLYDTTVKPSDTICTAPCDDARPCPTGFICLSVSQSFDVPSGRNYCARARPICGNHVVEAGEECDDGNTLGGDGCSAVCKREGCGNGVLEIGEECDSAIASSPDLPCSATCTYTTPANVHVVAPRQAGTLYTQLLAPAVGGNVLAAWFLLDAPKSGTDQLWVRRLTQNGALADAPIKLVEGTGLSEPFLSASSGGVALVINDSTAPRAFIGAADGTGLHAISPFPAGPMFTKMIVAAGTGKLAFVGLAWFPTDGRTAVVIIPVSWAGVAEPLIEVSALTLGSFDVLSAAYAATGELVFAWDETCSGCGFKVATLPGAAASTITTPTRLPDGPAGTSVGGTVIAGAAVPTVQISHTNNTPYAAVDDGVGRFSAGAWSWHTWSLDTTLTERRSLLAPAPDGSLVAADTRDVSAMPGVVELRFARVVADTMTFTTITTAQTSGPTIGVDRGGTTHVLFSAPAVPYTAGALLQHAQISSTGQVTAPGVLWTGGGVQVATSPDGDVYGFERQRMLLVHLGP